MYKVFIDGHIGTTGLLIQSRLEKRNDIELLTVADVDRKTAGVKREIMSIADVVILCLPDDAARDSFKNGADNTRFIDASSAHRVDPRWVYGLPELKHGQRRAISNAHRVTNPGCWATGFITLIAPLISEGILSKESRLTSNGVSGYSGGGKSLIDRYETRQLSHPAGLWYSRPYSLGLTHKHIPEMVFYSELNIEPIFQPSVGHYHQGMLVSIPLFSEQLNKHSRSMDDIHRCLNQRYQGESCVTVHHPNDETSLDRGFIDPQKNNKTNKLDIYIFGRIDQILLISVLDNLGKGASGAAVQNLNLMLGLPELSGL